MRGSCSRRCGSSAARQCSNSNGAQSVPGRFLGDCVDANRGGQHRYLQASASSTASPKPSRSEGTSTALAALIHQWHLPRSTPPRLSSRYAQRAPMHGHSAWLSASDRPRIAGRCQRDQGPERYVPAGDRSAQSAACPRHRAAPTHDGAPSGGDRLDQRLGGSTDQIHPAQYSARELARARMRHIGAVQCQSMQARLHQQRRPCSQAKVGVHHVQSLSAVATTQLGGGVCQASDTRLKLIQLDLHCIQLGSACTWSRTNCPRSGWALSASMLESTRARMIR